MPHYFVDESGSINNKLTNDFIIALVEPENLKKLRRLKRRFVSSNLEELRKMDEEYNDSHSNIPNVASGGMFRLDGTFKELKGHRMTPGMKNKFIAFFSNSPKCAVYYIKVQNRFLQNSFASQPVRAFNYVIRLWMSRRLSSASTGKDVYFDIDERNESPKTKMFLQEYLNTELKTGDCLSCNFFVKYYRSEEDDLVQLADVFSNFYYSYSIQEKLVECGLSNQNEYSDSFQIMKQSGLLKEIFVFPLI